MQRRDFLKRGGTIGAAAAVGARLATTAVGADGQAAGKKFKMKYAPHKGTFEASAGPDAVDQLQFVADQGFTAWEENGFKGWAKDEQERFAKKLDQLGMTMGVFVCYGDFTKAAFAVGDKSQHEEVLKSVRESVDVAQRVNAKWMTLVPGLYDQKLDWEYQTANCIDLLRRCAEVFEPHGLVMVLEPLNWRNDHPGLFLHTVPQAYEICRAVNSPACKILYDIYHAQIELGNLIPNIDLAWEETAYYQIGDNPGRNEPGTGEVNYRNIFKHLHEKGFDGVLGMEHGKSIGGKEGEAALVQAYRAADDF